jgi:hypothetical protein
MTARKALKTGLPAIILTAIAILPQADNASTAIAQERPRGIALSLIPEVRGIQLCDPLFFKIVVENTSSVPRDIKQPSRESCTLGIAVEFKPNAFQYESVIETGDGNERVEGGDRILTLEPGARLATYDRVFRNNDGDFIFRKRGSYRVYATLGVPGQELLRSETITIGVSDRPRSEELLVADRFPLLRLAALPREVYLKDPADIDRLENLSLILQSTETVARGESNLRKTLDWRIPLFKSKYGDADERQTANLQLDRIEANENLRYSEVSLEVLALLRAHVALDRQDPDEAKGHLKKLKDDSLERRDLEATIASEGRKAKTP